MNDSIRIGRAWAVYKVDGGGMGIYGEALVVCPTQEEAIAFQSNQAVLRKQAAYTSVAEVKVLIQEGGGSITYYILKDSEGFLPNKLKLKRLL